jgi:hypothetical protein
MAWYSDAALWSGATTIWAACSSMAAPAGSIGSVQSTVTFFIDAPLT